jgi:hypothetical protein
MLIYLIRFKNNIKFGKFLIYFFLGLDLFGSVGLSKLSIRSSIDLVFLVDDSLKFGISVGEVKLDVRDVRAKIKKIVLGNYLLLIYFVFLFLLFLLLY